MKVAIMQPYFLPYIGYWQLIRAVDTFVIYDNIEFTKKGWMHRNNILLNNKKTLFTLPLKKGSDFLNVADRVLADDSEKQVSKILAQIKNEYQKADFFSEASPVIRDIFLYADKNLFEYIYYSVQKICEYLHIETKIVKSSEVSIEHELKGQDKVIKICESLGAKAYLNSMGGQNLYEREIFHGRGIELLFLESEARLYQQFNKGFISHLSIIDIMMFNNRESVGSMLEDYTLI